MRRRGDENFGGDKGGKMERIKNIRMAIVLIVAMAVVFLSFSGALAADTGWKNPSANVTDTGGDGDGFEVNPANAYTDGDGVASNIDNGISGGGESDRHRYYNYGFSIPTSSTLDGIEVRLDWYMDSKHGANSMDVELSWDGGTSWTTAQTDITETTTEHTAVLGGSTDTWERSWSSNDFSDTNFLVRLTCNSQYGTRDFYLDWVPVKVYYTPPAEELDLIIVDKQENWVDTNNFTVSYKVKNQGCAPAGKSNATLYVDGVAKEHQATPALDPGESTVVRTFDYEVSCPCDETVNITVCADNGGVIEESDEMNNCEKQDVICPVCPKPDLIITDKQENWVDNNNFTVSYKVKNQGSCPAGESNATLYVNGNPEEHQLTPALGPGESTDELTFAHVESCPCGETRNIKVCADDDNVVEESDDMNNCVEQDVTPKPDLIITDKHENWIGNNFTVSYKVKNQGRCLAGASEATLYVNGVVKENQPTPALDAGKSTDELPFAYVVTCPCGDTVNVTVCADNENNVAESDETNNCEVNFVDRDLVITDIWSEGSTIYYNIKNIGSAKAPRSYNSLYVDGEIKSIDSVNELAPGKSSAESFWGYSWTCTSPYDEIEVCADYDKRIAELNEFNNCRTEIGFCPAPTPAPTPTCPDLVITDIWNVGSTIYYEIENIGGVVASVSYSTLYIDGRLKRADSVKALAPGESSTDSFTYQWSCTSTKDTIKVCADHTNRVAECVEYNNCRTETWTCRPTPTPTPTPPPTPTPIPTPGPSPTPTYPDLVITDIWNEDSTIYYEIKNVGCAKASISYSSLYIDGRLKRADSVKALAPGESSTELFTYQWSCTRSTDKIKVCADYTKRVAECNEYNNCRTETWTC
jgi:subtilase family serine protease